MRLEFFELSIDKPDGVLYFRTIAANREQALFIACNDDPLWKSLHVRCDSLGEVHGNERLIAMKQIAFVPAKRCLTCGK